MHYEVVNTHVLSRRRHLHKNLTCPTEFGRKLADTNLPSAPKGLQMLTHFAYRTMPQFQAGCNTGATVGTKSFTLHVHFHWDNKKAWKLPEVCVSADAGRTATSVVGSCSGVCRDVSVSMSPLRFPLLACTAAISNQPSLSVEL